MWSTHNELPCKIVLATATRGQVASGNCLSLLVLFRRAYYTARQYQLHYSPLRPSESDLVLEIIYSLVTAITFKLITCRPGTGCWYRCQNSGATCSRRSCLKVSKNQSAIMWPRCRISSTCAASSICSSSGIS